MKIRFLGTTTSSTPGYPFQAGQVIDVPALTDEIRAWLVTQPNGYRQAEVVPEDDALQTASVVAPERAVRERAKVRPA
jgi:hypothetical protein